MWIKVSQGRSKLDARYYGPGHIVQVLTPVSFIVEDPTGRQLQIHSNALKPVYPRVNIETTLRETRGKRMEK